MKHNIGMLFASHVYLNAHFARSAPRSVDAAKFKSADRSLLNRNLKPNHTQTDETGLAFRMARDRQTMRVIASLSTRSVFESALLPNCQQIAAARQYNFLGRLAFIRNGALKN